MSKVIFASHSRWCQPGTFNDDAAASAHSAGESLNVTGSLTY